LARRADANPLALGFPIRARSNGQSGFKSVATRMLRQAQYPSFAWQRNYYEHIIRSEDDLERIREYIANNPLQMGIGS
jgi:REP element-mobilizing transposase RayT